MFSHLKHSLAEWWHEFKYRFIPITPRIVNFLIRRHRTPMAVDMIERKFDVLAPWEECVASGDYSRKKWDFLNACKLMITFEETSTVALLNEFFKRPMSFKPLVILNLWLTLPYKMFPSSPDENNELRAMEKEKGEVEKKENLSDVDKENLKQLKDKIQAEDAKIKKNFDDKVRKIVDLAITTNRDLTIGFLQKMQLQGAVNLLETATAPPLFAILGSMDLPFLVPILLTLKNKKADRFKFIMERLTPDKAGQINGKLLEVEKLQKEIETEKRTDKVLGTTDNLLERLLQP